MGYENFQQEVQAYPVSRELMTVQPTAPNNSAILDLPNVNSQLPLPLTPRQTDPMVRVDTTLHPSQQQEQQAASSISNCEILESIQNITRVMQQQLLFSSKAAEQRIIQNASLFQEMIKAQEKTDFDPALHCSFQQELKNKSGILVQNFIRSLSEQITNKDLTEKILQFFSDVPMTCHALNKLCLI